MKRDMDLIRKLLFFFDEKEDPAYVEVPPIEGYDDLTIKHHLVLMHDAELIRCETVRSNTSDRIIYVIPFELTWKGHDFLESVRSDTLWKKVKDTIRAKGVGMTFAVVQGLAVKITQSYAGLE